MIASGCKGTSSFEAGTGPTPTSNIQFTYQVTVPLGATAAVHVPLMGLDSNATVTEAGTTVWTGGKLVTAVSGVLGAKANAADGTVIINIGSGTYRFAVLA